MDKVLTKEEILRSNIPTITFDKLIGTHISEVYNLMDEYANQEKRIEAIAFAEWYYKITRVYVGNSTFEDNYPEYMENGKLKSIENLYEIFPKPLN